jgi:hypothetical protein
MRYISLQELALLIQKKNHEKESKKNKLTAFSENHGGASDIANSNGGSSRRMECPGQDSTYQQQLAPPLVKERASIRASSSPWSSIFVISLL